MNRDALLQAIDRSVNDAKLILKRGDALNRLQSNKDFQELILTGYFKDEAVRLVHLKGDSNMQEPAKQAAIVLQIDAIAALSQFFNTVSQTAKLAEKSIAADEDTREELLNEID